MLRCPACGARWYTAAGRNRSAEVETCLRCGGRLELESDESWASDQVDRGPAETPSPQGGDDPTEAVRDFFEAWHNQDLERVLAVVHPDIEVNELAELLPGHSNHFDGPEGVERWMKLLYELWDVEFRREPREVFAINSQQVEVLSDLTLVSSDRPPLVATTRSLWKFEDGKLRWIHFRLVSKLQPPSLGRS